MLIKIHFNNLIVQNCSYTLYWISVSQLYQILYFIACIILIKIISDITKNILMYNKIWKCHPWFEAYNFETELMYSVELWACIEDVLHFSWHLGSLSHTWLWLHTIQSSRFECSTITTWPHTTKQMRTAYFSWACEYA